MGVHEDILLLELKLQRLKVEYDQYFAGIIKIPPFKPQEEVKRFIRKYSTIQINNTALAFKYKSLVGRYTSYDNLWKRHMRQIDEGTFKRGSGFAPAAIKKGKEDGTQAEKLFKDYISAKTSLNEKIDGIKVTTIENIIKKQTEAIKSKYKCSTVDYRVVTENGQAKIKAVPKK
ncbi:MAG: hypothetical protein IME96_03280 [Proteobacteria bacterium]|nr:hypothetical protein [Pseudomonadota bacterium]